MIFSGAGAAPALPRLAPLGVDLEGTWDGLLQTTTGSLPISFSIATIEGKSTVAVDILEMAPLPGVEFIHGDFREDAVLAEVEKRLAGGQVDLVMSDMAPNLSGIGLVDQARTSHLAELALEFALKWLKPGGHLLVKTFQGEAYNEVRARLRPFFGQLLTRKPPASRNRSAEMYLLGKGFTPS